VDYLENPPHYTQDYLNPSSYTIFVDAFPGAIVNPKGDQQARPGQPPPRDQWQLLVADGTTGFEFTLSGQPERRLPVGPRPRPVSLTARTALGATKGEGTFNSHVAGAAWIHEFHVPGPGSYNATVATLSAAGVGSPRGKPIVLRDILIVSIGDSAASGEGNPDMPGRPKGFDVDLGWLDLIPIVGAYTIASGLLDALRNVVKKELTTLNRALSFKMEMDPEPVWLERRAHRSLLSGHAMAARIVERARPGTVVTFLPFGRSGASIKEGLVDAGRGSDDHYIDNLPEIEEVVRAVGKRRIEALLIYVGINDIGITKVLTDLTQGDGLIWLPFAPFGDDGAKRAAALTHASRTINVDFPDAFKHLNDRIKERLSVRHVYLCEYPSGLFDNETATPVAGCGLFSSDFDMDISNADARTLQQMADALNAGLRKAAQDNAWIFVSNISNRTRGKGYCTDVWISRIFNQAEESLGFQGDTEGTVHPNGRGHKIIAEEVASMVLKHTVDNPVPTTHATPSSEAGPGSRTPTTRRQ
jgi:hypothetical protein